MGQHRHRLRRAAVRSITRSAGRRREQVRDAGIGDDLAAADHDQVIGGVLQFAHQVAGDQHRAALRRPGARKPRIHTMPSGSMPLNGSSIISTGGSPSMAAAMPSRCRMPSENPPAFRRIADCRPGLLDDLIDPLGASGPGNGPATASGCGRCGWAAARRVQQRPDVAERVPQAPVRPPADQRSALVGGVQAQDHPHRGRLPGAVRADEPGHLTRRDRKGHPVQR